MEFKLERIDDKIEFFEAYDLKKLEEKIQEKIEQNRAILLEVDGISHHSHIDFETGRKYFTASVHFKTKK